MLRLLFISIIFVCINSNFIQAADFVHPLDFGGIDTEKEIVVKYIKENVKKTYGEIGMDDPVTLRMMENEELKSFKQLTKVDNRSILDMVIKTYCGLDMCNYNTIYMMYNEQLKASQKTLEW